MGINQFDPNPDPHFQFLCEHGARYDIVFVQTTPLAWKRDFVMLKRSMIKNRSWNKGLYTMGSISSDWLQFVVFLAFFASTL